MRRYLHGLVLTGAALACYATTGCIRSSGPAPAPATKPGATTASGPTVTYEKSEFQAESNGATPPRGSEQEGEEFIVRDGQKFWRKYPDVPYVEIMTEVDGITIPRLQQKTETIQTSGKVPVDVGNPGAKEASEPVTGDWLVVRLNSEPQSLNSITETSAVEQYINSYVHEGLARQNPETLEYEPHVAKRWDVEDVVKLSADYPEYVRRVGRSGGDPQKQLEIDVPKMAESKGDEKAPPQVDLKTTDADGKALGGVWVGLYPLGNVIGAPSKGYHNWSEADGSLKLNGIAPGKYRVVPGGELVGKTKQNPDGSLEVTPVTQSPLAQKLESSGEKSLTLAKGEWVDVQEKTVYTYYLRDDVKWSDGHAFNAEDVLFVYNVINNPTVDGDSIRTYYADLVECKALDPLTVQMKYRQQYFKSFEFTYGLPAYAPPKHQFAEEFKKEGLTLVDEKLTEDEEKSQKKISVHGKAFGQKYNNNTFYNRTPLGTGPYIVDKWTPGDSVELKRNPNYWRSELAGHVDRLIFRFMPDSIVALQALKAGEIDFYWPATPDQFFEELEKPSEKEWVDKDFVKASWNYPAFSYYGWNLLRPVFQDRRTRIALAMLFDKQEFLEKKMHGAGVVVASSQYYFGPAYDHEVKPIAFDLNTASELLAEAGWLDSNNDGVLDRDGIRLEFELNYPKGNPLYDARALVIQENMKRAGIQMTIRNYEWASFIDKIKNKDFDVVNLGWAQSLESDPYQIWHSSGAGKEARGSNHVSFDNKTADKLIEMIRLTLDDDKRHHAEFSLERLLDQEQPYMFLFAAKEMGVYHKRFRGVKWYNIRPGFDLSEWYVPKELQMRGK